MAPIHALPLISGLTPRDDIKVEPGKRKVSIEAIFAIIGVGVAMLGIALTLNRKKWLCRTRRQNTTPCKRAPSDILQPLIDFGKIRITTCLMTTHFLSCHYRHRVTARDKYLALANHHTTCISMNDS